MSILLLRLLKQAEAQLAEGGPDAEQLCCQVMRGAATVANIPLAMEASALLVRIPIKDEGERYEACREFYNRAQSMQQSDPASCLMMVDRMLELTASFPVAVLRRKSAQMGISLSAMDSPERMRYARALLAMERPPVPGEAIDRLEMQADEGPARAAAVLNARGCVLIRGLFDRSALEQVSRRGEAEMSSSHMQAYKVAGIGGVDNVMHGRTKDFLLGAVSPFFMDPPDFSPSLSYFRKMIPGERKMEVPFHQDFNAFGFLIVNVWAPLVPCGRTAPGLEVVARRVNEVTETIPTSTKYDRIEITEALVRERFGSESLYAPEMEPGDAFVLLGTTIHRSYLTPGMTQHRTSLELRFA